MVQIAKNHKEPSIHWYFSYNDALKEAREDPDIPLVYDGVPLIMTPDSGQGSQAPVVALVTSSGVLTKHLLAAFRWYVGPTRVEARGPSGALYISACADVLAGATELASWFGRPVHVKMPRSIASQPFVRVLRIKYRHSAYAAAPPVPSSCNK